MSIPQFLLSAPASGSGKTTVSRGLMALLAGKGLKVQPFKCGPDYIDTKYHEAVCGRPSFNLDTFMASANHVAALYATRAADAEVCIVEGMMGMYDGYDRDRGSSAEIARLLRLPVVLVVDAKSAAYSVAPLLSGFLHFRPDVRVAGVIFNRVGSSRHYEMLREVCDDLGVSCFGYLPKHAALEQESRYLGLDFSRSGATEDVDVLVRLLEQSVDWKLLLEKTTQPVPSLPDVGLWHIPDGRPLHIAVARSEESFSFLYAEHLEMLHRMGTVSFFNPEQDVPLPPQTDLLYLPGGYPEKHARELAAARCTRDSIRAYIEAGGRTLAECGGMIYLSRGIRCDRTDTEQEWYEQTGVFPFCISNERAHRKLSLGYRRFHYNGQELRGHEFHYTQFGTPPPPTIAQVYNAKGQPVATPVFRYKNVIAGYTHLYWGEADVWKMFEEVSPASASTKRKE